MPTSSPVVQRSLARLRARLIRTARGFRDYNFRHYFVQHTKDEFATLAKLSTDEQQRFLREAGNAKLREMQRMVIVNRMYAHQPVILGSKIRSNTSVATSNTEAGVVRRDEDGQR